jgi:ADP-heptose:LPS heptosyltransferase
MLKRLWRCYAPNPFDRLLKNAQKNNQKKILIAWNRGLGDIPLGLYALIYRIRQYVPDAQITFLTRADLQDGFRLLPNIQVLTAQEWRRGAPISIEHSLHRLGLRPAQYDLIIPKADPTWWVRWQIGSLIPRLSWNPEWDLLWKKFLLNENEAYVGMHVQTETQYGYEKNWPLEYWMKLIDRLDKKYGKKVILFGLKPSASFDSKNVIDLRGKTSFYETLSIIKNKCSHLVVPDSGILSIAYYLDIDFPIRIVSLWADPRQGVLKQNVPSPNPSLIHIPVKGKEEKVGNISVRTVEESLFPGKEHDR